MNRCTLCGELSDGTIDIHSCYRNVQVIYLIDIFTNLRPAWLRTQSCCYRCLVTLSECYNLRMKAEDLNFYGNFAFNPTATELDPLISDASSLSSISLGNSDKEESLYESDAENSPKNTKRGKRSDPKYRRFEININASSSTLLECNDAERKENPQPEPFSKRIYCHYPAPSSESDCSAIFQPFSSYVSSGRYSVNRCRGYEQYLKFFNESFMPNSSNDSNFQEDSDIDSEIAFGICIGN